MIVKFEKRDDYIRASDGYLYGKCSRLWYFVNRYGLINYTDQDLENMKFGRNKHKEIQENIMKVLGVGEWEKEFKKIIKINAVLPHEKDRFLELRCHIDYIIKNLCIEIKPDYDIEAYIQILLQRLIRPNADFLCYVYARTRNDRRKGEYSFYVKANYEMAKIYLIRILRAKEFLTVIPPFHYPTKYPCNTCMYKSKCYTYIKKRDDPLIFMDIFEPINNGMKWNIFKNICQSTLKHNVIDFNTVFP